MNKSNSDFSRRKFIRQTTSIGGAFMLNKSLLFNMAKSSVNYDLSYSIFSKHLQFLDYREMADAAANLGFDGVDLTVRKNGHVDPEKVEDELPLAVEAIQKAGLKHDLMASDVNNAEEEVNRRVVEVAAGLGIKYYRLGYLRFLDEQSIPERLKDLNTQMQALASLNRKHGIAGAYQNHSGMRVGAQVWDLYHLLKNIDPSEIGCQYDIRHGIVEGGQSWEQGIKLLAPQINCIVLKDFVWSRFKNGRWDVKNVPLGEGMVDFPAYFKILKKLEIDVPVSVHYEYDLGGVEHGDRQLKGMKAADIFKMMKKDLDFAKKTWKEA